MKEPKTYTLFDTLSGLPLGRFTCGEDLVAGNVRGEQVAHEGAFDLYATRLDDASGLPMPYQPPQPDADHEWIASRWMKKAEALQREAQRTQAQARIDELERKQARRVRELLAESDPQLKALDQQIQALRADLQPVGGSVG